MRILTRYLMAVFAIAALSMGRHASASVVQVANRAALGGNLTIDWSAFPPPVVTPQGAPVGPMTVTVGSSQGQLGRHKQGVDYNGNFAAGDELLSDAGSQSDSFIVRFGTAVAAAGTQIERHSALGAFTAYMDFFAADNTLLNEIMVLGNGTSAGDNSAMFIGGVSSGVDIAYVMFWVDNTIDFPARSGDLLINRMDVRMVPAPGGSAVLLPLLGALGWRRRVGKRGAHGAWRIPPIVRAGA
jgi:hypothetical protein